MIDADNAMNDRSVNTLLNFETVKYFGMETREREELGRNIDVVRVHRSSVFCAVCSVLCVLCCVYRDFTFVAVLCYAMCRDFIAVRCCATCCALIALCVTMRCFLL
eukprot:1162681-Rhodomonas_salina.1